jgi:hypothetical protein
MNDPKNELQDLVRSLGSILNKIMDEADIKSGIAQGALEMHFESGIKENGNVLYSDDEFAEILEACENGGSAKGARYAVDEILKMVADWKTRTYGN